MLKVWSELPERRDADGEAEPSAADTQPPRSYSPEGRTDAVRVCALDFPQYAFVFGGCLHARHPACCSEEPNHRVD